MAKVQSRALIAAILIWSVALGASAQEETAGDDPWDGVWTAQGTAFSIRVIRQDQRMFVAPAQSMGFVWNSGIGSINGDTATIEVEYQGARGTVVVTRDERGVATARALSCLPETHLMCALARGQQVRFFKN